MVVLVFVRDTFGKFNYMHFSCEADCYRVVCRRDYRITFDITIQNISVRNWKPISNKLGPTVGQSGSDKDETHTDISNNFDR